MEKVSGKKRHPILILPKHPLLRSSVANRFLLFVQATGWRIADANGQSWKAHQWFQKTHVFLIVRTYQRFHFAYFTLICLIPSQWKLYIYRPVMFWFLSSAVFSSNLHQLTYRRLDDLEEDVRTGHWKSHTDQTPSIFRHQPCRFGHGIVQDTCKRLIVCLSPWTDRYSSNGIIVPKMPQSWFTGLNKTGTYQTCTHVKKIQPWKSAISFPRCKAMAAVFSTFSYFSTLPAPPVLTISIARTLKVQVKEKEEPRRGSVFFWLASALNVVWVWNCQLLPKVMEICWHV